MTSVSPEEYWAYKAFKRDDTTEAALQSSEIFRLYKNAEANRESELIKINESIALKEEEDALNAFADFQEKVKNNPNLLNKLRKVKAYLDSNPDIISKLDQDFVNGLNMLEL